MQRSYDKKEYPGKYEGSCGGSIKAGETKEEGAIREVFEESGLVINEVTPTYYFIPVSYTHLDVYKRQVLVASEELKTFTESTMEINKKLTIKYPNIDDYPEAQPIIR